MLPMRMAAAILSGNREAMGFLSRLRTTIRPGPYRDKLASAASQSRSSATGGGGESITTGVCRQRRLGPIAGFAGDDPSVTVRIRDRLPRDTRILGDKARGDTASESLVVDFDCCWFEDRLLRARAEWEAIVHSRRLGDVEGAFAIAWLGGSGNVSIARDAVGERTLYYAIVSNGFVFASTIQAILDTNLVSRTLHLPAVAAYLSYAYLPGRETLVQGISELLPGEIVTYDRGTLSHDRHWTLPAAVNSTSDETALRQELRSRLQFAVSRRLPHDEPVGIFLSGGLDSSLVVALACSLQTQFNRSSSREPGAVKTYSLSFGPGYANELEFSSAVAQHCGTEHRLVELSPASVLQHLDEVIGMLSDPIGDPLTVPNAILFRAASSEVSTILNGEGGDPCFGGPKNLPMLLAELYGDGTNGAADPIALRSRSYLRAHLKCFDELPQMLGPDVLDALSAAPLEAPLADYFRDSTGQSYIARLQAMNISFKGAHHILPKVDALSRPFGILPRSPLFDRRIVELSLSIPAPLKLRGSVEKYLLKEAVRDLLPTRIVDRPKSGMLVPVEAWFQGPLRPAAQERLLDGLAQYNLVRREYLERLLNGRLNGLRPRHGAKIWLLLTLEAWIREVLGGSGKTAR